MHPSFYVNLFADFLALFPPCIHAQALTLIRQSDRTTLPIDDSEVLGTMCSRLRRVPQSDEFYR